ncbi:hypothetical protein ACFCYM_07335 [Streptomyces sp. NPDC056254]|uniref:hypothetical protein n=1 Tax=Streptomyces sp. NPDC056254 TaxID=3345763 RepID=UPI0035DB88E5
MFVSLLAAPLGDETTAVTAQDTATAELPATLPRAAPTPADAPRPVLARAALEALPPEKHSLTLRLLMTEVEQP